MVLFKSSFELISVKCFSFLICVCHSFRYFIWLGILHSIPLWISHRIYSSYPRKKNVFNIVCGVDPKMIVLVMMLHDYEKFLWGNNFMLFLTISNSILQ